MVNAALRARAVRERRSLSSTIRLILEDAVQRLEDAVQVELRGAWQTTDGKVTGHDFTPQQGNVLRCVCGARKADHR